jgi:hypothetical protein
MFATELPFLTGLCDFSSPGAAYFEDSSRSVLIALKVYRVFHRTVSWWK